MIVTYCPKCNRFYMSNRISNYCKACKSPNVDADISYEKFTALSVNERYKLAFKLTEKYRR